MNTSVYTNRLEQARSEMREAGIDCLLVGPSADLVYLTGAHARTTERMSMLVLPREGTGYMVVPFFEAALLPEMPGSIQVKTWGESDNPARLAASLVPAGSTQRVIGVADQVWAAFLLHIQNLLPEDRYIHAAGVLSALRQRKTTEEEDLLRRSSAIADEVFAEIIKRPFAGRTEDQVAADITDLLKARGALVPGGPIVASGPNSASPHHHTGGRTIGAGDVVVIDFGGTIEGYYSDITRTVFVGGPPPAGSEEESVYNLVRQAQEAAVQAAKPGMACEDLDAVARDLLTAAGYGEYFSHRLGHGIGLDGHEPPYLVSGNKTALEPGMAFSIEPGLYLPGKYGVRVEDTVILHEDGAERLNNASREITAVA